MTNRNRWFVKLNRNSTTGYFDTKQEAEDAAQTYRRYGFPKAKAVLEF